ncbi:hypothetical protein ACI3KS_00355 [Microbacterium sp. ZW T5_45]|uniref:hypothetical protein n=1 Tax=Microbacterium sp. ZW T5_45 TaxID=3378080 RepID=UPI0038540C58
MREDNSQQPYSPGEERRPSLLDADPGATRGAVARPSLLDFSRVSATRENLPNPSLFDAADEEWTREPSAHVAQGYDDPIRRASPATPPVPLPGGAPAPLVQSPQASLENTAPSAQATAFVSPFAGAEPRAPRKPLSPVAKHRIRLWSIIAGSAIVLVIAGVVGVGVLNSTRGPQVVAEEYLAHLAAGNASAAARIIDPGVPNDQRLLLSDDALAAADARLVVRSVELVQRSDTGATVLATMSVDGEQFSFVFDAVSGEREFLVLDTWRLTNPMIVPLSVGATVSDSVALGDIEVPVTAGDTTLYAYPGVYSFSGTPNEYLESSPASTRIVAASDEYSQSFVDIEEAPSPALSEFILAQAQAEATACATVPTNLNEICPYSVQATNLSVLQLKSLPEGFDDLTTSSFQTTEAVITIQSEASSFYAPPARDVEFSLSGTIDFVDGQPVIDFGSGSWY